MTGTSCILTLIAEAPLLDPEICNVKTIEGNWGPFVLLETGGDAMRWARRAFHGNAVDYDFVVAEAAKAEPGSGALFFMPYLTVGSGSAVTAMRGPSISASAPRTA